MTTPRLVSRSACVLVLAALLAAAGCSGSGASSYRVDETDVARGYLPSTRELPHAADSLAHLTIAEKDGTVQFETARSYEQMLRAWSSTWQSAGASATNARQAYFQSYATLWSLEASITSLQPEMGVQGLTAGKARELIARRRTEYRKEVQIDVYQFIDSPQVGGSISDTEVSGPGRSVVLEDDAGHRYRPSRSRMGIVREAFGASGRTVLYRRNVLFFSRTVEGRDILSDARELRLRVNDTRAGAADFYYTWTFPPSEGR